MDERISEAQLSDQLGLSRPVLRKLRQTYLLPEVHWFLDSSGTHYTRDGLIELVRRLGLRARASDVLACLKPAALLNPHEPIAETVSSRVPVVRIYPKNYHVVTVRLVDGTRSNVGVHDSRKMRIGMLIRIRKTRAGSWRMIGRGPRYPGRM